jgi:riboflavin synthase
MFTGIVQAVGKIASVKPFVLDAGSLPLADVRAGDSICVQGACLTVTQKRGKRLLRRLAGNPRMHHRARTGSAGEPEKALRLADRLGGHLVSGHVDGVGLVVQVKGSIYTFRAPKAVAKYVAPKGSICIDGVSLTVNRVRGAEFDVNLIPHTLKVTTLARLLPGAEVNMEADQIARYAERLLVAPR